MRYCLLISLIIGCFVGVLAKDEPYRNLSNKQVRYAGNFDDSPVFVPVNYKKKPNEWRGVWVATVANIDFAKFTNKNEFCKAYIEVLNNLQSINATAVLFQIRPTNDAFYPSKLNPWSRYLAGEEGRALDGDFDPLKFMIDETHKRGLEFHAWLNPYRVVGKTKLSKKEYLKSLDKLNFAKKNPDLVLEIPQGSERMLILNPGEKEVKEFIVDTVSEIIQNYKVDAIHFDDYFYPYSGMSNQDESSFRSNNPKKLGIDDWRRENVNEVVYNIYRQIKIVNKKQRSSIEFGISPFGIWANKKNHQLGSLTGGKQAYSGLYADIYKWVKNDWIDYVVPQIYWDFNHDIAAYAVLADWWSNAVKGTSCKFYVGHSAGRIGTTYDKNELAAQLRYDAVRNGIHGECIFSYKSIFRPSNDNMRKGVYDILKLYWK